MIERIDGAPAGVLAFRAVGKVEAADYENVLTPAIEGRVRAALAKKHSDPDEVSHLDGEVKFASASPRYDRHGVLQLVARYWVQVPFFMSDGNYTSSVEVVIPALPKELEPWAKAPPAVVR